MNGKFLGGILLIVGISIGAGMLALPVTTAQGGFLGSLILLFACWAVMTFGAFLILEVNLWFPNDTNLISMAKHSLGKIGELITWLTYLLLLYSLIAAYTSGGSDVLHSILLMKNIASSARFDAIIFILILGSIVYLGVRATDYVNRGFMFIKFLSFILLVIFIAPYVDIHKLESIHARYLIPAITVVITSFGFATIVPTIRTYFNDDIKKIRKAVLIGSLIPLICYIIWVGVILGDIPLRGKYGLIAMLNSSQPTTILVESVNYYVKNSWVMTFSHIFTSICVATSFLGVSLSLVDFLADGMRVKKQGKTKVLIFALTYLPPLILVMFFPGIFILCLSYAGIFCAVLLILLPAIMAWHGRYIVKRDYQYRVFGGKSLLIIAMIASIIVIIQQIMLNLHLL